MPLAPPNQPKNGDEEGEAEDEDPEDPDPEDPDEYRAGNCFWVPQESRWKHLQDNAKQAKIGKLIDDAMVAIERDNPRLKGVLPKDFARPALDKHRLGELIQHPAIGGLRLADGAFPAQRLCLAQRLVDGGELNCHALSGRVSLVLCVAIVGFRPCPSLTQRHCVTDFPEAGYWSFFR